MKSVTNLKWVVGICAILLVLCVGVLIYAFCTKQIQYIEKAKDVIENPEEVEQTTQAVITMAKCVLRI